MSKHAQGAQTAAPKVGIVMGSQSDWATMRHASETLTELGVPHECRIVSAHRTPQRLNDCAGRASHRGPKVNVAGPGAPAPLPGMTPAMPTLPVLSCPFARTAPAGVDKNGKECGR